MSSKGRAALDHKADPNGFFETQPEVTRAGMTIWNIQSGMRILQPGCGAGAIAKVLRREFGDGVEIIGVEIDKKRAKKAAAARVRITCGALRELPVYNDVVHQDFFEFQNPFEKKFDFAIENPSFSIWLPVAERCFEMADRTSLLIPWNAAASKMRALFWAQHPAYMRVLSKRPSFCISVKCMYSVAKNVARDGGNLCTFQELIPLSAKPKKKCPKCGEPTISTRSDSNEYSWTNWGPDITRNLWDPLETPEPHPDDKP
jgi:hypothetical protein